MVTPHSSDSERSISITRVSSHPQDVLGLINDEMLHPAHKVEELWILTLEEIHCSGDANVVRTAVYGPQHGLALET